MDYVGAGDKAWDAADHYLIECSAELKMERSENRRKAAEAHAK